jgi:hypothetical protein
MRVVAKSAWSTRRISAYSRPQVECLYPRIVYLQRFALLLTHPHRGYAVDDVLKSLLLSSRSAGRKRGAEGGIVGLTGV